MSGIPIVWLDWSGSVAVVISLFFLFRKNVWYWHFSNLSLLPYFLLFTTTSQFMLAGLQISYLIFGVHGFYLWNLEQGRDILGKNFNEPFWYNVGWVLCVLIFGFTIWLTQFHSVNDWLQFVATSLALIANWATTRKWNWSWLIWILVNGVQAVLFYNLGLWAQFGLQGILATMSIYGFWTWRNEKV